jgi:hypothetical protein
MRQMGADLGVSTTIRCILEGNIALCSQVCTAILYLYQLTHNLEVLLPKSLGFSLGITGNPMLAIVPDHKMLPSIHLWGGGQVGRTILILFSRFKPLLMRHCVLGSCSQVSRRMVNHVITAIETRGKHRRYLLLLQACIVLY